MFPAKSVTGDIVIALKRAPPLEEVVIVSTTTYEKERPMNSEKYYWARGSSSNHRGRGDGFDA